MKKYILLLLITLSFTLSLEAKPRIVHVMVALCDNDNQGIVPVPKSIGNGQDPNTNLYWGALYGVRTYLKKSPNWDLLKTEKVAGNLPYKVLERIVFKHAREDVYLVADAYDGAHIQMTTLNFIFSGGGYQRDTMEVNGVTLPIGGSSDLIAYVGHNGLMDFTYPFGCVLPADCKKRDVILLGCITKSYFKEIINCMDANPLLWTTGLMAPEAYTLDAAVQGWIKNESAESIQHRAAAAYHKYQKCGIKGASNLLVTGY